MESIQILLGKIDVAIFCQTISEKPTMALRIPTRKTTDLEIFDILFFVILINYVLYIVLTCLLSCLFVAISLINFTCLHNPIRKGAGMFNSAGSVSYVQVVT